MNLWTLLGVAVGLAMDALAVSIAAGLSIATVTPRHVFRLAFHFGLFQFLMPMVGWLAGRQISWLVGGWGAWAAPLLLGLVGGKMVLDARRPREEVSRADPTRGFMLIALSVATSLDALAVGMSMGLLGVPVWSASVVIGLVAAALTAAGILFGSRLGPRWQRWADVAGGGLLLAIGLRMAWLSVSGR